MDAKTAVETIKVVSNNVFKVGLLADDANAVVDFIEHQETQLLYLKANAEGEKLAREALQEELTEQIKYAELGRLAERLLEEWENSAITAVGFIGELRVKKRAELLAEVQTDG